MATVLGKRKRVPKHAVKQPSTRINDSSEEEIDIQAAFKKAFEAKFRPLKTDRPEPTVGPTTRTNVESNGGNESDWTGFSESETDEAEHDERDDAPPPTSAVQIVEHGRNYTRDRQADKKEHKAFMSSKPPSHNDPTSSSKPPSSQKPNTQIDDTEADNLENDLALQRLLQESHLLESSNPSMGDSTVQLVGRNRVKALDLRLEALGGKRGGLTAQRKMAMSLRKGIDSKARERDEKRRKEARENGIILERATGGKKGSAGLGSGMGARGLGGNTAVGMGVGSSKSGKKRERGMEIGAPSIGKFRNGALVLSERDLRSMQSRRGGGRGGKSSGRGRGR